MSENCYACGLTRDESTCPGGTLLATESWVVQHCTGPLPVGTLVVKPIRHCLGLADLLPAEASELGPLLRRTSRVVNELTEADQVYVCLWSHSGWEPAHIHFVVQPVWQHQRDEFEKPGPFLQADLFRRNEGPSENEVRAFSDRAREELRETEA